MRGARHLENIAKYHLVKSITATGLIGEETRIVEEKTLKVNIRNVNAGNVVRFEGRIDGDTTWKTIQDITGAVEEQLVNVAVFDYLRVRIQTLDIPGASGDLHISSYYDLFQVTSSGEIIIATGGTVNVSGLSAFVTSEVTIDDSSWTAVSPTGSLTTRAGVAVQNFTGFELKIREDNTGGYVGIIVPDQAERFEDWNESVTFYLRAEPGAGSVTVNIEEVG